MASKSKKRRRVFRASCILAALIIAGSSFAWFTSKDEVTNRLSASTDYGVSIVESFVPPKQWVPGQTINKDVYAVNTGNIDAFVKESISGNLSYTYEKRVETAPTNADDAGYVRLDTDSVRVIDGATTHEAGGYLAWSNARTPVTTTITIDDATFTTDEEKAGYVDDKDETFVKLVNGGTFYWIKKSDLDEAGVGKKLYNTVGTPVTPAVEAQNATDSGLTLTKEGGSTLKVGDVVYTVEVGAVDGYNNDGNVTFYKLTSATEGAPEYYVTNSNPADGAKLYADAGTRAADAIPASPAELASETAEVEKGGNKVSIVPGPVNSATLTDVAQSADGTDKPGAVAGTRWHPEDTGVYIFRRSFTPNADPDEKMGTFTYAGYYYVASDVDDNPNTPEDESEGKYYKIVLGSDDFRAIEEEGKTGTEKSYIFDVSATQEQLGYPTMIEIDPVTGAITGDVAYSFVKEVEVKNVAPDLVYHANGGGNDDVAYLQAIYSANDSEAAGNFLQKQAIATAAAADADEKRRDYLEKVGLQAAKEAEYENAVGEYNSKKSRYDQAVADWEYAKALSEASKKLSDAAKARAAVQTKVDNAKDALDDAYDGLIDMAADMHGDTDSYTSIAPDSSTEGKFEDLLHFADSSDPETRTDISYNTLFQTRLIDTTTGTDPKTLEEIITSTANQGAQGNTQNHFNDNKYELLRDAHEYMDAMKYLWNDATDPNNATTKNSIVGASAELEAALDDFKNLIITGVTSADAEAQAKLDRLVKARDKMKSLLEDYKKLYQSLRTVDFAEGTLTALTEGTDLEEIEDEIGAWISRLDAMKTFMEKNTNPATAAGDLTYTTTSNHTAVDQPVGLNLVVADFKKKYEDYYKANTKELPAAEKAWEQALRTYNSEVGNTADGAQGKYYAAIDKDQRVVDPYHTDKDDDGYYTGTRVYQKNDYEGLVKNRNNEDITHDSNGREDSEWHLTNNNNDLVNWFAIQRPTNGTPTIDSAFTEDEINNTGKNLWKEIGGTDVAGHLLPTGTGGTDYGAGDYTFYPAVVDDSDPADDVEATANATYTDATNVYTRSYIAMATTGDFYTLVQKGSGADSFAKVSELKTAYEQAADDLKNPETAYAQAIKDTAAAKKASDRAATVSENAERVANEAMAADASAIKINILLDDNAANLDWTSALADGDDAKVAEFYYNYVLGAGQTSEKLIDAVELDPSLTARDYKELVFDLNVKLDSAQVTYADDQRTITTEAVSTPPFNMTATVGEETAKGVKVTWDGSESVSPTTIYRVGTDPVTPKATDGDHTSKTVTGNDDETLNGTYKYYIVKGDKTYYGKSLKDGTKFYEFDGSDEIQPNSSVTLNVVE